LAIPKKKRRTGKKLRKKLRKNWYFFFPLNIFWTSQMSAPCISPHVKPKPVDEYDVTHNIPRTPTQNSQRIGTADVKSTSHSIDQQRTLFCQQFLQSADLKPTLVLTLQENGAPVFYVSAVDSNGQSKNLSFVESAVLGEGSFGRVIKAILREKRLKLFPLISLTFLLLVRNFGKGRNKLLD
jgi:hypothetical protein